ncbi:MAG: hypothetical protein ACLFQC_06550 [Wenzhouxiangella sp.]
MDAGLLPDGIEQADQLPAEIQGQEMAFGLLSGQAIHDMHRFQVVAFPGVVEVECCCGLSVAQSETHFGLWQ